MPDFWEFPTVSMGLGPISAIYQARFDRYLQNRGLADTSGSRVWAFLGDGEMDEPESIAGLSLAARDGLDNLTFVVNCNLQRLDGPVRGNGKVIQELEGLFRGAGWNVIKVIWGREWDDLLARDVDGVLVEKMNETLDGEFQKYSVAGGAYIREHFFGPDPRLAALVEHLTDDELAKLRRGGHDYRKVYAAYKAATEFRGAPDGHPGPHDQGLDPRPGGRGPEHHPPGQEALRGRGPHLPRPARAADPRREAQGGAVLPPRHRTPRRSSTSSSAGGPSAAPCPGGSSGRSCSRPSPPRSTPSSTRAAPTPVSTTMVFARLLRNLIRDPELGRRIVPIVPDEARTFGLDPLFKEVGIYAAHGQRYEPVDSDLVLSYREARDGQVLEEGITEAGSMASFLAAATAYSTQATAMIPFYVFYSMFGFQRTGDQVWQLADARGRGFMMGATAGRTTLHGEGLQHDDGHSHLLASTIPAIRAYDPAFAYELATIVRAGIESMYVRGEDVFYYVTIHNENYAQPPKPEGVDEGIIRGLYRFAGPLDGAGKGGRVRLVGSGSILQQVLEAQRLLAERFDIAAEVYSAPSFQQLRRDAIEVERWNRLHPGRDAPDPLRERCPRSGRRSGRHRHRLAQGGPRPRRAVAADRDDHPRHRGLRSERHPRGAPCAVRDRRPEHRGGRAVGTRPRRPALAERAATGIAELGIDPEKIDPLAL